MICYKCKEDKESYVHLEDKEGEKEFNICLSCFLKIFLNYFFTGMWTDKALWKFVEKLMI